jgi:catechol-2,3-dioxygenase
VAPSFWIPTKTGTGEYKTRDHQSGFMNKHDSTPQGDGGSIPTKLDHCVIHVSDWERSNAFYTTVLGAELVTRPTGYAYRFGDKQLNVHGRACGRPKSPGFP